MKDLFRFAISVLSKSELVSVLMISHRIWQARNEEIFQSKFIPASILFSQLKSSIEEWKSINVRPPNLPTSVDVHKWIAPLPPYLKLNVNAALDEMHGIRVMGAVLRNEMGELMIAVSKGLRGNFSVKTAEVYAAALGLQVMYQSGFHTFDIILKSDALSVISDLTKDHENWSVEGMLNHKVKNMFHLFHSVICTYCPRKCNQAVHRLARNTLLFLAFQVWVEEGPQWLSEVLLQDVSI